ncbi:helix-turn-helix domain-containing protein [Nostoc favosum]|uniref:Helix-turn-helix domain-containing protein n=1 Tax=Nostoc favosum CHAB5714 TaxID=2780399 RepID=A0ABS8ID62_9NOSO|nr:helix-turn-helix transcriptional regulator [Nostoc favosum]MCC5602155.1 helix-turn-helix domain-containing protein [Nostoc favosum CHAB5714]
MDNTPQPQETLALYVKRIRTSLSLSQNDLATKAGIHLQSLGKIERGMTTKLNSKSQRGLAIALQVPSEYLDAVIRGVPMSATDILKFCPHCWQPGTTLEEIMLHLYLAISDLLRRSHGTFMKASFPERLT